MKLIYLTNVYIPGMWAHSIQVMKMCEAFKKIGLETELITGMKRGDDEEIFSYYNIKTKFKITKIPYFDFSSKGSGKLNFLMRTFSFIFFTKLKLLFKKYDILYIRTPLIGIFFNNFYLEVHELPPRLKQWHKKVFKKAKKIIVLTSFLKKELVNRGVQAEKIIIAPDAVNLEEFQINLSQAEARKKLSLPLDKKIIMYCGNFYVHDWKGVDILLKSLEHINNALCVLVGGHESEFNKIRKQYQSKNLILIKHQPHENIPVYLKVADALILPNKKGDDNSEYYTSPLKLFEYMASGNPIVASDLPSIREVLNETNAVMVEPNNPEKLALGVRGVLENNELAKKISTQALLDVKNYTWQKRAEKIIKP
ncbi:MAG: glycosyltransferase family 4 protein [Patescibacteria group bacterium]|jgi:glycosyltransferase involved in cell wall biosynthesis